MPYSDEFTRWNAYQSSDPFATGSFLTCNKITKIFCQPACDAHPITNLRNEIKFVNCPEEAREMGYVACTACEPCTLPTVDVQLLIRTVESVNASIGFVVPTENNNDESGTVRPASALGKDALKRRSSVPIIHNDGSVQEGEAMLKNDSDHYRLVSLACRHLALAAAASVFGDGEEVSLPGDKKKRRGGVLGFKELAAKSKLSAWHFHRVFKSVTNLTPKAYGDKCWDFLKSFQEDVAAGGDGLAVTLPTVSQSISIPTTRKRGSLSVSGASKKRRAEPTETPVAFQAPELVMEFNELAPPFIPIPKPTEQFGTNLLHSHVSDPNLNLNLDLNLLSTPQVSPYESFSHSPMDQLFEASEFLNDSMFYTTTPAPELALNFSLFDPSAAMFGLDTMEYNPWLEVDNVSLNEALAHLPPAHMVPELHRLNTELRLLDHTK